MDPSGPLYFVERIVETSLTGKTISEWPGERLLQLGVYVRGELVLPVLVVEPGEHPGQAGQPPLLGDDEVEEVPVPGGIFPAESDLVLLVPTVTTSLSLAGNLNPVVKSSHVFTHELWVLIPVYEDEGEVCGDDAAVRSDTPLGLGQTGQTSSTDTQYLNYHHQGLGYPHHF